MSDHIDEFNKIISGLESLEAEVDNEDKAIMLLNSLPESYEHLNTTLLYGKENIVYDGVTTAVLANEKRLNEKGDAS